MYRLLFLPASAMVSLLQSLPLTWVAWQIVSRTTRTWFERDVAMRAELAVNGARQALLARWSDPGGTGLRLILTEITRDERIMAAAACDEDRRQLASTPDFPSHLSCEGLARELARVPASPEGRAYRAVEELPELIGLKPLVEKKVEND